MEVSKLKMARNSGNSKYPVAILVAHHFSVVQKLNGQFRGLDKIGVPRLVIYSPQTNPLSSI